VPEWKQKRIVILLKEMASCNHISTSCPKLVVMVILAGSCSLSLTLSSSVLGPTPLTFCPFTSNIKIKLLILVLFIETINPELLTVKQPYRDLLIHFNQATK